MKGVVNKGIQELVEARFGAPSWEAVKARAGCDEPFFAVSEDYPDESTMNLIAAVSEISGLRADEFMVELGKHWVPQTGRVTYPSLFRLAGSNPREFLLNLNRVHRKTTKNIPNASPPEFVYEELPDGRLRMHYHSQRGLCLFLRGQILGVGLLFGQELRVEEIACTKKGDGRCTMEITFP